MRSVTRADAHLPNASTKSIWFLRTVFRPMCESAVSVYIELTHNLHIPPVCSIASPSAVSLFLSIVYAFTVHLLSTATKRISFTRIVSVIFRACSPVHSLCLVIYYYLIIRRLLSCFMSNCSGRISFQVRMAWVQSRAIFPFRSQLSFPSVVVPVSENPRTLQTHTHKPISMHAYDRFPL